MYIVLTIKMMCGFRFTNLQRSKFVFSIKSIVCCYNFNIRVNSNRLLLSNLKIQILSRAYRRFILIF